ncbi:cellulase family glycosylhydrolase [Dactylosporangium aurantiacum]|uniref:Endoglucanase n=1 Tax=Dactylosporangium aurantiacum TaxID=35754 RepID=A0A9Q9IJN6_9ACTN|nr:cellulase family glycosylhydrolase [Dactylosporangium aurantiacum]MDG6104136.1 cellulase family glycosylhydrolase [Dactylosporangium aurantiacum]UWZ56856.1 cellulase family glycosylhydrolase [Dactylosporangium aurantiacum]
MRTRITLVAAAVLSVVVSVLVAVHPAQAATGFTVSNGRLYDANGNEFVMRGVSHAHTWYQTQTSSFANIKALGANTVRVVLATGDRWAKNDTADVANVVSLCKANRLICVLEAHDTTGYGEQSGAITLDRAVDYWLSVKSALVGQEKYVIVNIGNEPYGNNAATVANWATDTANAVKRLRSNGFEHTIMVDAPNWGQDWSFTMRDNAAGVFAADPLKNTVFSIHMYGVFDTAAEINDYLNRFVTAKLPIVVGEFGFNHSDGNPDEDTIMATSQSLRIGYLGWSWSGNGGGVEYLDMVTGFNPAQLTSWGERIFNGANGIKATAKEATVYGGTTSPSPSRSSSSPSPSVSVSPSRSASSSPQPAGACKVTYTVTNQWPGGFQGDVKVTNTGSTPVNGWRLAWTWPNGQVLTQAWGATYAQSGAAVTMTNESYTANIPAGGTVTFGFLSNWTGSNTAPAAFTLNGTRCA